MRLFTYAVVSAAVTGAMDGNWFTWLTMNIGAAGYALVIWTDHRLGITK